MSIVHTESSCGWGWQEIRVLEESAGLAARGHSVQLLCAPEARIREEARKRGISVTQLPISRKSLRGLFALTGWLKRHRPDVINTHSSTDSWLASLAVRASGQAVPIVRTRHISAPLSTSAFTRWLYAHAASRVVTTGEALRAEVIAATGASPRRVESVPTGVDLSRFLPGDRVAARAGLDLPAAAFLVGIVATLRSWKGHAYLVEALAQLADPDIRLVIVGDGPGWGPLHEQIARLGIAESVVFAGNQADPVPWFQSLDLFTLPSYANEGVPQAVQQAMACGLPVVTTPVGAITEIVADGKTGLFVAPRDAKALSATIARLKPDRALRERLGHAAREHALAHFSRETMLDRMEAVFADAASPAGAA
ncbi:MAG: glycosyltransferase family 4 protein [Betaproteobacteria bacterium]|nr:glycosyltransferase family 4 protein [Betaproteobacteria bacterium]